MNFWKQLKHIFKSAEQDDPAQQNIRHEVISRTEEEKQAYEEWLARKTPEDILNWVYEQYQLRQIDPSDVHDCVDFLAIPSMNGFVLHYDSNRWDGDDFVFLLDFLKAQVKTLGYRGQVSDLRTYQKNGKIETIQRHYLKPPRNFQRQYPEKIDQHYGNIMVVLTLHNERIINLKFSATHYNDSKYQEPYPFENLMADICD